jgi:hypothetical protein
MQSTVAGEQIHGVETDWFLDSLNTLPHVAYLQFSRFNKLDYRKTIDNILS